MFMVVGFPLELNRSVHPEGHLVFWCVHIIYLAQQQQ